MDVTRFAISAITTQKWSAWQDLREYRKLGLGAMGLWRDKLGGINLKSYRAALDSEGMTVTNLCFTGQFTLNLSEALADGERALDEAAQLGAPALLVISGPIASHSLDEASELVVEGLGRLAELAGQRGVALALEALHPMDMTQWTIIPTVDKALDIIDEVASPNLGLMLDLYNSWWDPGLYAAIERGGSRILCVQLADWRNPTRSFTDRTVPGDGVAELSKLVSFIESVAYQGYYDLEIFSDEIWNNPAIYEPTLRRSIEWWRNIGGRTRV